MARVSVDYEIEVLRERGTAPPREPLEALVAFYSVSLDANPKRAAAFMNKLRISAPSKAKRWQSRHVNQIIDECVDFWTRVDAAEANSEVAPPPSRSSDQTPNDHAPISRCPWEFDDEELGQFENPAGDVYKFFPIDRRS